MCLFNPGALKAVVKLDKSIALLFSDSYANFSDFNMYTDYYRFKSKPFDIGSTPKNIYFSDFHKEALSAMKYGVMDDRGFILLTGPMGTGKTTLIHVLVEKMEQHGITCVISNPSLTKEEFYYYFSHKLGVKFDGNKARFLVLLNKILHACKKKNSKILLIIDEAHVLPTDLLEEIRLLSNMTNEVSGVLSIFLVGQPELIDRLEEDRLLPLKQRISIRYELRHFPEDDTLLYIRFRLAMAGLDRPQLFSREAFKLIHKVTGGNPRLINILCDNALLIGFAMEAEQINRKIIEESAVEMGLIEQTDSSGKDKGRGLTRKKRIAIVALTALGLTGMAVGAFFLWSRFF